MASVSLLPKGSTFVRACIASALHPNDWEGQIAHAGKRWGPTSPAALYVKTAVGSTGYDDASVLYAGGNEFLTAANPLSILRAPGWRYVEAGLPVALAGDGMTAAFVPEGAAIPISKQAYDRWVPKAAKVATITVVAKDLLRSADPRSEALIRGDLLRAAALATDQALFDIAGDGSNGAPQSLIYGLVPVSHDGSLPDAVRAAVSAFQGDLTRAIWVVHPTTAALLGADSMILGTLDLGARGGSIVGLPAFASAGAPVGELILLDPGQIGVVDQGIEFAATDAATLEMVNDPAMDSQAPTAATGEVVSLFQTDDVGIKLLRWVSWKARAGSVIRVELDQSSGA